MFKEKGNILLHSFSGSLQDYLEKNEIKGMYCIRIKNMEKIYDLLETKTDIVAEEITEMVEKKENNTEAVIKPDLKTSEDKKAEFDFAVSVFFANFFKKLDFKEDGQLKNNDENVSKILSCCLKNNLCSKLNRKLIAHFRSFFIEVKKNMI